MLIYIEWFRVIKDRDVRVFDAFNELFIGIINYHMISFALLERNKTTRWTMGKSAIAFLTIALIANFGYIIYTHGTDLYKKLRYKYYEWKKARILHKLRSEAAARLAAKRLIKSPKLSPRFFSDFYVLKHIDPTKVIDDDDKN